MAEPRAPELPPSRVVHLETVDSTNAEALRRVAAGERGPLWIVADRQAAGRGRSGRSWSSEPGNFFASFLTVLPGPCPRAYQISLVTGVAVAEALCGLAPSLLAHSGNCDFGLRLKWPNDLLVGRAKIGGVLVECTQLNDGSLAAVIGIGLNLVSHPSEGPRPVAHLAQFGASLSPQAVLSDLDRRVSHWLSAWAGGQGFAAVREAWLRLSGPPGERLMVNSGSGPVEGLYQGLDHDGALILTDDAGIQRFYTYGDVTLAG